MLLGTEKLTWGATHVSGYLLPLYWIVFIPTACSEAVAPGVAHASLDCIRRSTRCIRVVSQSGATSGRRAD